jgi:hypothetical protein
MRNRTRIIYHREHREPQRKVGAKRGLVILSRRFSVLSVSSVVKVTWSRLRRIGYTAQKGQVRSRKMVPYSLIGLRALRAFVVNVLSYRFQIEEFPSWPS